MEAKGDGAFSGLHNLGFQDAYSGAQGMHGSGGNGVKIAGFDGDGNEECPDVVEVFHGVPQIAWCDARGEAQVEAGAGNVVENEPSFPFSAV